MKMKAQCTTLSRMGLVGLAALTFLVLTLGSQAAFAQGTTPTFYCIGDNGDTLPGPNMTIEIHNNSSDHNIYPVLFAGARSDVDQWMRGCFRITPEELDDYLYPRHSQYRMYVNCCDAGENGIPPHGSVQITLPFYSPLVASINPKVQDPAQFVDWWQGGGINIYKGDATATQPPAHVLRHWQEDNNENRGVVPYSNPPTCSNCSVHFFTAPASIPNWEPQQLIEYTLAAAGEDKQRQPGDPMYLWVPDNVDYDISNVNYTFMPAAIEPYGNTLQGTCCAIGWVGSIDSIADAEAAIASWQGSPLALDWPLYVDQSSTTNPKATVPLKIPSALEIFLNYSAFDNTNNYSPAPNASPPIQAMVSLWEDCQSDPSSSSLCTKINNVTAMLQANFENYKSAYKTNPTQWNAWGCGTPPSWIEDSVPPENIMLAHLYGWGPFNEACAANANLLENTPGYDTPGGANYYPTVKGEFDDLQYSIDVLAGDYGSFDPYVALIHGPDYLDALYTYAYSVDDALGNMQTDGKGLIIAVGGPDNLPNPDHVTPEVLFTFGYSSNYGVEVYFSQYGRCTDTPDTDTVSYFTTFVVPAGIDGEASSVLNCTLSLEDSVQRLYKFKLKKSPSTFIKEPDPKPELWPDPEYRKEINEEYVDCSGLSGRVYTDWCLNIFPYKALDKTNPHLPYKNIVSMPAPPPFLPGVGGGAADVVDDLTDQFPVLGSILQPDEWGDDADELQDDAEDLVDDVEEAVDEIVEQQVNFFKSLLSRFWSW